MDAGWATRGGQHALISPDTITQVRERTDIVAVVLESVPTLKRRGRTFSGLCPFHKEKTPSFHVNPERGFFHCFGCKESGSVIDFVMKQDGYTFPEAVRYLAERLGIDVAEERSGDRTEAERQKRQRDDLYAVNHLAATFYEQQLREHPQRSFAQGELARRGLVPSWAGGAGVDGPAQALIDDAVQAFRIGYAPSGWDGLATFLRAQGVSPVVAESVGLLVPRSSGTGHYDRFRHRLMFAIVDAQGRVLGFSGRVLPDPPGSEARDDKPAKYINSPESAIYSKGHALFGIYQARHAIRQQQLAVLVEGNFDVVSLHAHGIANVVAPLGTAFTPDQATLLKRFTPNAVLLFDADAAGKKAVFLARDACRKADVSAKVAMLPEGKDPDDLVRSKGAEAVKACIAQARGMLEYLLDVALDETFVQADAYERAARVEQVGKLLAEEQDPIVRSMGKSYADRLAGRLDIFQTSDAFQALERSVMRALASAPPLPNLNRATVAVSPRQARIAPQAHDKVLKAAIVGAIIEFPELLSDPELEDSVALLEGLSAQTIAALAKSIRIGASGEKNLDTSVFLAQIPPAIQDFASKRLAAPQHETLELARANLLENAARLRKLVLSQETAQISRSTHRVGGDWQAEVDLGREAAEKAMLRHGVKRPVTDSGMSSTSSNTVPAQQHDDPPEDPE